MLQITIPAIELWDENKQEFIQTKDEVLLLEHSLISISKWESKWNKVFLSKADKSFDETIDYIKCMTINKDVSQEAYLRLTQKNIEDINNYIGAPMTATTINEDKNAKASREPVTSELIYYWMISLNIPFECQKWHINRLLTLIKVCNIKNAPPKKQSKRDILSRNAALNAARRKQYNTKG